MKAVVEAWVMMLMVTLSAAFDMLDHGILLEKLELEVLTVMQWSGLVATGRVDHRVFKMPICLLGH